jgi:hypothetical protein
MNANYDDGQFGACADNYSALGGDMACGLAGMSEYQRGLNAAVPSYCNQVADYANPRNMYNLTQVPTTAAIQYYPTQVAMANGNFYVAPKIGNAAGEVIYPANLQQPVQAQQFINRVTRGVNNATDVQKAQANMYQQRLAAAAQKKSTEGFDNTFINYNEPFAAPKKYQEVLPTVAYGNMRIK